MFQSQLSSLKDQSERLQNEVAGLKAGRDKNQEVTRRLQLLNGDLQDQLATAVKRETDASQRRQELVRQCVFGGRGPRVGGGGWLFEGRGARVWGRSAGYGRGEGGGLMFGGRGPIQGYRDVRLVLAGRGGGDVVLDVWPVLDGCKGWGALWFRSVVQGHVRSVRSGGKDGVQRSKSIMKTFDVRFWLEEVLLCG